MHSPQMLRYKYIVCPVRKGLYFSQQADTKEHEPFSLELTDIYSVAEVGILPDK